ncbi:MAG TPA: hypothetical protein VGE45_17405 [Chloroflexia bacterium]|jgi:hypothetical protein
MEGITIEPGMPDEDLFGRDTEQWLRKYKPDWSDEQIREELRKMRVRSLLEFYEAAIQRHPDLEEDLPLLPATPSRPPKSQKPGDTV